VFLVRSTAVTTKVGSMGAQTNNAFGKKLTTGALHATSGFGCRSNLSCSSARGKLELRLRHTCNVQSDPLPDCEFYGPVGHYISLSMKNGVQSSFGRASSQRNHIELNHGNIAICLRRQL